MDGVAARLVSRVFRALGADRSEPEQLRRRLETQERTAAAHAVTWKETRRRLKAAAGRMKAVAASLSRRVPSPDIVQELLPHRLGTLAARRAYADADRYDDQLAAISAAYREAAAAPPSPKLATIDLQGVTWTVPVPASITGERRDRFVREQQFPYRTIAETREFAVGPVLLDIGANIGLMSIPRVILGDVTRAYCAEPDPLNFAALVRNVVSNGLRGLVLPDQAAIGATTGPMRMRLAKYPGGHRVVPAAVAGDGTLEVPGFTLDDWCDRLAIDPDVVAYVKVDVQGSEVGVLRGASRMLAHSHIAWQLEVNPGLLEAAGTPVEMLYELCAAHFTHFVDLDKMAQGARAQPTGEFRRALARLGTRTPQTDLILFNAGARLDARMNRWEQRWLK